MTGYALTGRGACAVLFAVLLAGCGGTGASGSGAAEPAAVSMSNPAAVHCEERGGKVTIESRPEGQAGVCLLPDGSRVDEWELYRRDFPEAAEIDKP
ncbi:hypothetical protein CBF45_17025 [Bordetella sp. J329]|jgi:putative hemolysin|uniref:putative hemolysin n=1 Tax=Kerstersia gyiorum TaxID=206506 RepID=UPI000FDCCA9D|nr:DUF333 domain-containing protein [Kerstersia gyiorum]AZV95220.1 hypothetical protein CBF45_17025 [Bordetella sp. J329]MCH4272362.1 DUF333 domain-containing protein [Kerstersia gyiorum]MCI1229982.1 DUF333 domain-containing protein [Kerstersia gyiorum]